MIPLSWDATRLFLHVVAATIWVGGQLTLAALLPALRTIGRDAPKSVACQYNKIAWPAFAVLIATGIWNIVAERNHIAGRYETTLIVKLVVVVVSGVAAFLHIRARSRVGLAVFGALTGLSAVAALLFGVLLAG